MGEEEWLCWSERRQSAWADRRARTCGPAPGCCCTCLLWPATTQTILSSDVISLPPSLPPSQLPAPCFNVFEHHRSTAHSSANNRTTFSATALLPHTGLQLTPDAAYSSPSDAQQNAALLALLWLDGGLDPGCGLVHFAAAGEMAQVGGWAGCAKGGYASGGCCWHQAGWAMTV